MALTVTAWALTTFGGQVVESYKEADVLGMPYVYRFDPGQANGRFPKIANRSVTSRADGAELTAGSVTEGAIDVGFDNPESVHDLISYQQVRVYNMQAPTQYARSFGRQLAEKNQNNLVAYAAKVATGNSTNMAANSYRTDDNGVILFDDDGTDGTAVASAVLEGLAQMTKDKVPGIGRIGAIDPIQFNQLRKVNYVVSKDYVSNEDNKRSFDKIVFGNATLYSLASIFGTDISADTDYAAKYRVDLSAIGDDGPCLGVMWQDEALAVREAERPNGRIDDIADKNSWLIQSRCIRGMESLQPTAFIALVGDVGT